MDKKWTKTLGVKLHKYLTPILVFNVNRTPNKSESIMHYAKILVWMRGQAEWINAAISDLGKRPLILEHNWLKKYNPDINQKQHLISFLGGRHTIYEESNHFAANRLFTRPEDKILYTLDIAAYLRVKKTKANTIASKEFVKALKSAKKALLLS